MSSLIRQSHATNDEPLWLSTNGGVITGDIEAQYVIADSGFTLKDNSNPQTTVLSIACATNNPGGDPIFQVNNGGAFRFGQVSQSSANTELVPSAPGSNLDSLVCGGQISATGIAGSRGMALFNSKYLSCYDATTPTNIEAMRIGSGTTGTPGLTFSEIGVQPGSQLYLNAIGVASSSFFRPNYPANDYLQVDGKITTQELSLNNQSCGTGTIPVGATNVVISSTRVTATSKIFLSFYGSPSSGPGAGPSQGNLITNQSLIVPGTSFRIDHTDATGVSTAVANVPCTFNWMIIN